MTKKQAKYGATTTIAYIALMFIEPMTIGTKYLFFLLAFMAIVMFVALLWWSFYKMYQDIDED